MAHWNKDNTIYIMAPKGYARKGIEEKGIRCFSPYFGDDLPLRVFREICFRLPFLPKTIWYRKEFATEKAENIIIVDVNITSAYLKWLKKQAAGARLFFVYDNMVGKARNISPDKIPDGIKVWTYDDYDSRKYHIHLFRNYWIREIVFRPKQESEYDVFFIGSDKGRGEKLLALEKSLNDIGLRTKFIITKGKRFSRTKKYYQQPIPYDQVIEYDTRSRAILNMTMENQEGVTMRDIEALAIGVKLITTNRNIVNKDLYHRNNVFILGVDDLNRLPAFLDADYVDMLSTIRENHTFEALLDEITGQE